MKMLEMYKEKFERVYSQSSRQEIREWESSPGRRVGLLSVVGQHIERVKEQEKMSDNQNRVFCIDFTWEQPYRSPYMLPNMKDSRSYVASNPNRAINSDPVYQRICQAQFSSDKHFKECLMKNKLKYSKNSKQHPKIKAHRQLFRQALWEIVKKFEKRQVNEQEYEMLANTPLDQVLSGVYLDQYRYMENVQSRWDHLRTVRKVRRLNDEEIKEFNQMSYIRMGEVFGFFLPVIQ